eukprot:TRINITY_DN10476_c0_g1_i2.p1 TRINITY_DN10476_c0_g1~~TRINITY_DN10476_c0_g1_i2.p1  ORF type:complete len:144 (-),score=21.53 TRINITY_DN10476_c0_g1_i2:55-486(-)
MLILSMAVSVFLATVASSPSKCELSIVNCCQPNTQALPFRCFEVNGCPGLIWHGKEACGEKNVASTISALGCRQSNKRTQVKVRSTTSLTIRYNVVLQTRMPNFCSGNMTGSVILEGCKIRPVVWGDKISFQGSGTKCLGVIE